MRRKLGKLLKTTSSVPGHFTVLLINGSCSKLGNQQLFIYFTVRSQRELENYFSSIVGFVLLYFAMLPLRVRSQDCDAG